MVEPPHKGMYVLVMRNSYKRATGLYAFKELSPELVRIFWNSAPEAICVVRLATGP